MNVKASSEDLSEVFYDQQVLEADMLGNALLAGFLGDKIADNKKKIANKLNITGDYSSYKAELDKLQTLKIANVHRILKIHEENDPSAHIYAAEKLLCKIEKILNAHVKYNANDVVSKEEIVQLKNHMNILQSMKTTVKDVPNNAESKNQKVEDFNKNLMQIVEFIESTSAKLNETQISIIKDSSDILN
ncbi:hypothetical protein ACKWTF_002842 [Chironomus riparius]